MQSNRRNGLANSAEAAQSIKTSVFQSILDANAPKEPFKPWVSTNSALRNMCHTSEREFDGTYYTISDERWPEFEGLRIRVWLEHGIDRAEWIAPTD